MNIKCNMDDTCIACGRIIPEGRQVCLQCAVNGRQQTFKPSLRANYPEPFEPPKPTNGGRIRSMTDEQLIPVVFSYACHQIIAARDGCPCDECDDCIRAWLKQEAQHEPD